MARRGFFESRYSVCPTPPPGARTSGSGIKWGFRSVLDFLVECFRSYISPIRPWNCSPVYRRLKKKLLSFNGSKNLTFEGYSEKSTSPLAPSSKMIWNAYPSLYEEMAWWTERLPVEELEKEWAENIEQLLSTYRTVIEQLLNSYWIIIEHCIKNCLISFFVFQWVATPALFTKRNLYHFNESAPLYFCCETLRESIKTLITASPGRSANAGLVRWLVRWLVRFIP